MKRQALLFLTQSSLKQNNFGIACISRVFMENCDNSILIIDEAGFSQICAAILELEGFPAETVLSCGKYAVSPIENGVKLIITSYPYCLSHFERISSSTLPVIILSDHLNHDVIRMLEVNENVYCMIKPLDYRRFKSLVREVMSGEFKINGGYNIV